MKWLGIGGSIVVLAGIAFVISTIGPRNLIGMIRYDQREEGTLKPGDHAPDVKLVALDGSTVVHLRERIGRKPLVLIFGSFT